MRILHTPRSLAEKYGQVIFNPLNGDTRIYIVNTCVLSKSFKQYMAALGLRGVKDVDWTGQTQWYYEGTGLTESEAVSIGEDFNMDVIAREDFEIV